MCLWRKRSWCAALQVSATGQRRSLFAPADLYLSALSCSLCFRFICLSAVNLLADYFRRTNDVHPHDTRHKAELFVGACSLQISRLNPAVSVPRLYNALPSEIRDIQVFEKFVTRLRKFLYAQRFYSAAEYFDFVRD
jgi:hypothetical protein